MQENRNPAGTSVRPSALWIALAIGNSRLHWALFFNHSLQETCHTPHFMTATLNAPPQTWMAWQQLCPFLRQTPFEQPTLAYPDLWVGSVVPSQTRLWQSYPRVTLLQSTDIPLKGMYSTLGLDRAIALWGAGTRYGWPTLVIDSGTALTFTGADGDARLVGGAIMPGLGLQSQALNQGTAALPSIELPHQLPEYWARETETALQSGVIYGAIATLLLRVQQWDEVYPGSSLVLTGGDAAQLAVYLQQWHEEIQALPWLHRLQVDCHLVLKGIALLRSQVAGV